MDPAWAVPSSWGIGHGLPGRTAGMPLFLTPAAGKKKPTPLSAPLKKIYKKTAEWAIGGRLSLTNAHEQKNGFLGTPGELTLPADVLHGDLKQ